MKRRDIEVTKKMVKEDIRKAIINNLDAPISFRLLDDTIIDYWEQYGKFPRVIYLSLRQYLDYPFLFPSPLPSFILGFYSSMEKSLARLERGEKVFYRGILLKPVREDGEGSNNSK